MHVHLRRQLARLADSLSERGGTAMLLLGDASRVEIVGFECEMRPPGFSVADVVEWSTGHLLMVRVADEGAYDLMDVPLARITGIRSNRTMPTYLKEAERRTEGGPGDGGRLDLEFEEGLRRFVGDGLVASPTGFARKVMAACPTSPDEGIGPEVVMAAEAHRLADPRHGDPRRGRHVPDLVAALCETLPKAAKAPDAWFANLRHELLGPLGRDLRDLHDVGGVGASVHVALRCVGRVGEALSRR